MKKKKYPKLEDFDFSDYKELTGAILFKINGGKRIENSILLNQVLNHSGMGRFVKMNYIELDGK